ncbi:N-acetylneuraminate synthase [Saccharibacillus sp. O23]|uniref:N-acetylneuraminate synthase n=1 Tax=Saccharibacillus sp. O23 TaxID=2009338 RepID=UPI000B4E65A0|nr:N-acetylneuraminate synthase [Saccharibacillus sp. O23]OWR27592.1 N-acetylneuraminate synthase [Saccharibacillus sp. O23]
MSIEALFGKTGDHSVPVYIIAEIGVNHNGSLERAKSCIDEAVNCGANAVKFQTFKSEKLVTKQAQKADYQTENTGSSETQLEMLKKLELSFEDFTYLKQYCKQKGIDFLSTPFDEESAAFLDSIDVHAFKIGSGDMNNIPLLRQLNRYKRPVLLSTGMADLEEIQESLVELDQCDVAILHCTSDYPAPLHDVNLAAIQTLKRTFNRVTGYSDHTEGVEITLAAVAMGARIIEKHFTVDRNLPGPDHQASLEPAELRQLIAGVRHIELAWGDGQKRCMPSEENTRKVARKSVVAARDKKAGEVLAEEDLSVKRPGTGLAPKYYFELLGRELTKDIREEQLLSWDDVR